MEKPNRESDVRYVTHKECGTRLITARIWYREMLLETDYDEDGKNGQLFLLADHGGKIDAMNKSFPPKNWSHSVLVDRDFKEWSIKEAERILLGEQDGKT